uniref:Uncharacterized protein n=1 Tax=Rhizophora mucronata TaxID=61149 RepID=A0A2P2IUD8_RHIMU
MWQFKYKVVSSGYLRWYKTVMWIFICSNHKMKQEGTKPLHIKEYPRPYHLATCLALYGWKKWGKGHDTLAH